jgi:hypothetical protein
VTGQVVTWDDSRVRDWQQFLDQIPWLLQPGETAVVGAETPWNRGVVADLPELSALLRAATVTPVSIADKSYELLAWGPPDSRRGWLTVPPGGERPDQVHRIHTAFWTMCGGIVEWFREPVSWWNNQNEVLTASAARTPLAKVLADYAWLWENNGPAIPIQSDEYCVVAVEANGNLTIASRETGQLLLFAPDHAFTDVTPLPGCPPYSLLTIDDIPDLGTWIEVCAEAWADH